MTKIQHGNKTKDKRPNREFNILTSGQFRTLAMFLVPSTIVSMFRPIIITFFTSVVTMLMGEPFGMPHSIPGPLNWLPLQINDHVCCDFAIWYLVIIGYLLYILDMILLPVFWVWIVVNCHFATFGSWRWTCCQDYFIIFVLLIGIVIILSLWSLSLFASLAW